MHVLHFRHVVAATTLALLLPLSAAAQTPPKSITFGADLTPNQRAALLQRFGGNEKTDTIFTVTVDDMRAAMQNILPIPAGYTSVSSTALTCAAAGSGLRVSTEHITKVSAAMYAAALVTAGVGDAQLIVAAPAEAPAEGMTGLTGVFKGLESGICGRGTLDPKRRDLAYRQLAVTADLATATGGDLNEMSDLMLRAQQNLVRSGNNADAAAPSAASAQHATGVTLPQAQSDQLVQLLAAMGQAKIDWGTYAGGWSIQQISPNDVRVAATVAATNGAAATAVSAPAGTPSAATIAPASADTASVATAIAAAGQLVTGRLANIHPIHVAGAGIPEQLAFDNPSIIVVRNEQPAKISDLQLNDTVNVTFNANNQVQRIEAHSAASVANGAPTENRVQGVVTRNADGKLDVKTGTGDEDVFANQGTVQVRRNGQAAQLGDIQLGDNVTAQLDSNGRSTMIDATSAQTAANDFNPLWCIVPLLFLIPLIFLLLRRRRKADTAILVGPNHNTVIDEDGSRTVVDNNQTN